MLLAMEIPVETAPAALEVTAVGLAGRLARISGVVFIAALCAARKIVSMRLH